ncbi:hypothetical protein [Roseisolibacter sp. H3M3-2]|uniref:hypothetical protein n=1 Tax=Roseisolibacter sp. H3M3-2 TaxID=3031323 RepID=UPI0023DC6735|nr:hypothetical protein [Roseisolibacter sp. H3M3-2]MDF1505531.1 hypothetical protein [Roseisolibacter sp. H3M3-2]
MTSPTDARPPAPVNDAELAVARAVARRLGRPVFAVVGPTGRHLLPDPPDDPSLVAYAVDPRGRVQFGRGGRPAPPAPGASLVREAAAIPPVELAAARYLALAAGATVFVAAPTPGDPDAGARYELAPPRDGTLRFAVRPGGALLLGDAAREEPPRRVRDTGWVTRTGPAVRALHRLAERGEGLAALAVVTPGDWGRMERLVPRTERDALHPKRMVGLTGRAAAAEVAAAVEREFERLRELAESLLD